MANTTKKHSHYSGESLVFLEIITATLLFAGVFICAEISLEVVHPIFLASCRFILAAFFVGLIISFTDHFEKINFVAFLHFTKLGFIGICLYNIMFFKGLFFSNPLHASIIIATTPAWGALIAYLLYKEKITLKAMIGILLAFIGVMTIITGQINFDDVSLFKDETVKGDIILFLASFFWAYYCVDVKKVATHYGTANTTLYSLLTGSLMLVALTIIFVPLHQQFDTLREFDWYSIAYMGAIGTAIGYYMWNDGLKKLGSARGIIFLNFVPVWGALLSIIFLDTVFTFTLLFAFLFVISGVLLVQKGK